MSKSIYRGQKLKSPAKKPELYEDMPVSTGILAKYIGFTIQDRAFYFRLSQKSKTTPKSVLPYAKAKPVFLNPLNFSDEEFLSKGEGPVRSRYLYAIDNHGIHVALERARSIAERGFLTHTNLCKKAYFAGEVFFLSKNRIILTPNSGRFGLSPRGLTTSLNKFQSLWKMTIKYWESCGFMVYPTVEDITDGTDVRHLAWNGRVLAKAAAEMLAQTGK